MILFIYGWNQYLWPLLITTSNSLDVIVVAIKKMIGTGAEPTDWHIVMSTTILALIPPVLVIILDAEGFCEGPHRYRKVQPGATTFHEKPCPIWAQCWIRLEVDICFFTPEPTLNGHFGKKKKKTASSKAAN